MPPRSLRVVDRLVVGILGLHTACQERRAQQVKPTLVAVRNWAAVGVRNWTAVGIAALTHPRSDQRQDATHDILRGTQVQIVLVQLYRLIVARSTSWPGISYRLKANMRRSFLR